MRPWRAPALHFVLLGATLFALRSALDAGGEDLRRVVIVPAPEVERIVEQARRETGREPDPEELAARVAAWVDEELLVLEARAMGWDRSDPVVQRRLIQNARFLAGGTDETDDAALLERARALGLDRSDVVVRRRLVARMRLAIAGAARATEPDDAELEEFLRRHPERFREAARVRLTQVFLSRDRRGEALEDDAATLLAALREQGTPPDVAAGLGDPSLLPTHLPLSSERELAARFGAGFGRAALGLAVGQWQGPVASSYGLHAIWPHERRAARMPSLDEVRAAVTAAWMAEREQQVLADALATLRSRAEIHVEGVPASAPRRSPGSAAASGSAPAAG